MTVEKVLISTSHAGIMVRAIVLGYDLYTIVEKNTCGYNVLTSISTTRWSVLLRVLLLRLVY